jgi:hypothetical protein
MSITKQEVLDNLNKVKEYVSETENRWTTKKISYIHIRENFTGVDSNTLNNEVPKEHRNNFRIIGITYDHTGYVCYLLWYEYD